MGMRAGSTVSVILDPYIPRALGEIVEVYCDPPVLGEVREINVRGGYVRLAHEEKVGTEKIGRLDRFFFNEIRPPVEPKKKAPERVAAHFKYEASTSRCYYTDPAGTRWKLVASGRLGKLAILATAGNRTEDPQQLRVFLNTGRSLRPQSWDDGLWLIEVRRGGERLGTPG